MWFTNEEDDKLEITYMVYYEIRMETRTTIIQFMKEVY